MESSRFDGIARRFAELRLTRRAALRQGSAGLTAGAMAAGGLAAAAAQEASPTASETKEWPKFLYLQSFQNGSITQQDGEDGKYTLTLEHGLGQTVYFSDRPQRKVGAAPTGKFLDSFDFNPKNPPNAALLVEAAPGDTDIAVLELTNPTYDEATHTATYDVQFLKNYEQAIGVSFAEQTADLAQLHPIFGSAHLFIDDCADGNITCTSSNTTRPCPNNGICGSFPSQGFCHSWSANGCVPCDPYDHLNPTWQDVQKYWDNQCNSTFPACSRLGQPSVCGAEFNN